MGMQYDMPDGSKHTEWFKSMEDLQKRKKAVQRAGGKVQRVVCVYEGAKVHTNPRYPTPHQGAKEIERRCKAIERLNAKITAEKEALSA